MKTTIRMNTSELTNGELATLINKELVPHAPNGVWRLAVGTHTDHTDTTFPCVYDIGLELERYNVVVGIYEDGDAEASFGVAVPL